MSRGILYILTGDEYLNQARRSAKSVREVMPEVPIAIITDIDDPGDIFDTVILIENPCHSLFDKVQNIQRTPFEETIYIDVDTVVTAPIGELFDLLDSHDLAVAHAPRQSFSDKSWFIDHGVPEAFPQFNTGVLVFKKSPAAQKVLDNWKDLANAHREAGIETDQMAFRKVIYESDANIVTLRQEYNCLIYFGQHLKGPAKVVHGRGNLENAAVELNKVTRHRTFVQSYHTFQLVDEKSRSASQLFIDSLRIDGVLATLRRIGRYLRRDTRFKN